MGRVVTAFLRCHTFHPHEAPQRGGGEMGFKAVWILGGGCWIAVGVTCFRNCVAGNGLSPSFHLPVRELIDHGHPESA